MHRHRRLIRLATLLPVAGVLGCELFSTAPSLPDDAVPLERPAIYALWWDLVEQCAGRSSNIAGVRWFVAPDVRLDGEWYRGCWWENGNRILLAEHAVSEGRTVRHEMLPRAPGRR